MERSPPPLFNQGPSALARLVFFAGISVALLLVDARLQVLLPLRQALSTVLYPLQQAMLWPRHALRVVESYWESQTVLQRENAELRREQLANAQAVQAAQRLMAENAHLRRLLKIREQRFSDALATEVLYDARDPFSQKIIVDRGQQHGVQPGQPVIDAAGVVGQVVRVNLATSEVMLLTDREYTIPVQIARHGLRALAFGGDQERTLELRFMATNVDVQKGDLLTTSGLDGVYPAGLAVGRVISVDRNSSSGFASIVVEPVGGVYQSRHLLILSTISKPPREVALPSTTGPSTQEGAR